VPILSETDGSCERPSETSRDANQAIRCRIAPKSQPILDLLEWGAFLA
jgi:hypothetical protein